MIQVKEQGYKWRLSVCGHQRIDLILNGLHAGTQFVLGAFLCQFFYHFRRKLTVTGFCNMGFKLLIASAKVFAQVANIHRLSTVLAAGNSGNDLCQNGAGNLEALWAFNQLAVHNGAVVQHIANVNQAAVENWLEKIVGIVKVNLTVFMGLRDFLRQ